MYLYIYPSLSGNMAYIFRKLNYYTLYYMYYIYPISSQRSRVCNHSVDTRLCSLPSRYHKNLLNRSVMTFFSNVNNFYFVFLFYFLSPFAVSSCARNNTIIVANRTRCNISIFHTIIFDQRYRRYRSLFGCALIILSELLYTYIPRGYFLCQRAYSIYICTHIRLCTFFR